MPESTDGDQTLPTAPSPDLDGLPVNRPERLGEQIGADDTTAEGIETAARPPSNPIHDTLLLLSRTMEDVKETLIAHGKKFDILTRDAEKGMW
ncbi:hypothetical protein SISSUDRAFT_1054522 [Sistotremastrum suecicum HHB10207 ss-3]|uniref:Uncharacterized protein n=1 Tax=Sistotremastrum suecicum HHB10207 ss-3 TaxID=1314776 RepID=A0A165YFV6_9AGAM|nr:hypothetical protein SISSUDRAFT_1054522 [Sistotremastrum suecicum HHB10207 ss-3]